MIYTSLTFEKATFAGAQATSSGGTSRQTFAARCLRQPQRANCGASTAIDVGVVSGMDPWTSQSTWRSRTYVWFVPWYDIFVATLALFFIRYIIFISTWTCFNQFYQFSDVFEHFFGFVLSLSFSFSMSWGRKTEPVRSYADHLHVESLIPENGDQSRQVSDERTLPPSTGAKLWRQIRHLRRRRCCCCRRRPGVWLHCAGLVIVLTVVLSVDQEQQKRARIVEQGLGVYSGSEEESVRWLNMVLSIVWTPLQKTISGLGEELATLATFTLSAQEQDALSIAFENVTGLDL